MKIPGHGLVALAALAACGAPSKPHTTPTAGSADCYYNCGPATKSTTAGAPAAAPVPDAVKKTPAGNKAADLRDAADLLEKAAAALAEGNKDRAEELFSRAELITGPEALASIAGDFRAGAPPRVTTPMIQMAPSSPQPMTMGSSEAEDAEARVPPPRVVGSLRGTLAIDGKPLSGTYGLVTLEPASGHWKPRTPKHRVIEQRMREFRPHIMAVPVGSTIAFPNFDTTFHNVFSTSPIAPFDLGLYKSGEAREFTFTKEGIVRLGCNLHANMSAYIAVVAAPAYVVTDEHGNFTFEHLEPGTYKLKAWSEKSQQPIVKTVTIKAGKNQVEIGVAADAPAGPMPDKFGGKRG